MTRTGTTTGGARAPRHRRVLGPALAAGAVGALLLAGATACASTGKSVSVSSGATSSAAAAGTASPSASSSGSASPGTGSATPTGTGSATATLPVASGGGLPVAPSAQLTTAPAGTKYTPFQSAEHSADGKTLYLGIESQGGACGKYDVVLEQSGGSVSVGLVHLPASARICPMYVTHMLVTAKLSAPLDGRRVIDLANGQTVGSAQIG